MILVLDQVLKPIRKEPKNKWINRKWFVAGTVALGLVIAGVTKFVFMDSQPNNLQSGALTNELSVQARKPASNPPIQNSVTTNELFQPEARQNPEFIEYPTNLSNSLIAADTQHEHVNLDHLQNDQLSHAHEQNPEDHLTEEVYDSY
jgi:hypothetical protein